MITNIALNRLKKRSPPDINPECIKSVLEKSTILTLSPKETLVSAGDIADTLHFILDGSVKVILIDEEGREMIVSQASAGDFIGEFGVFDASDNVRSAWVVAKTQLKVARISYRAFYNLSRIYPDLLVLVGAQVVERLKITTRKLGDLAFLEVTGRVSRCLLELCETQDAITHPDGIQIKLTRQDLGSMVGCTREMAGKVLKGLQEQGLIDVSGKTITVLKSNISDYPNSVRP